MLDKLEEYVQNKKRANENFIFFSNFIWFTNFSNIIIYVIYGLLKNRTFNFFLKLISGLLQIFESIV